MTTFGFAPTEKMLTPTTLARMLEISDRHLTDVRREDPTFPAPVLLGTLPRWSPATIRRWMERSTTPCCDGDTTPGAAARAVAGGTNSKRKAQGAQRVF
ncbi:hypothetical protein [Janibacter terrae]|uniref:hypothetical protein n=1 Tax=Janibacter terrae TaxID=103817 RepID=UPI00380102EF